MNRTIALLAATAIAIGASASPEVLAADEVQVEEVSPSPLTAKTRQVLAGLPERYDLGPFLFTRQVRIQSRVVPHSHPVLTLNTFYGDKPDELLSVFLHEQLHWFVASRVKGLTAALSDLRRAYPGLPERERSTPQAEHSTYLHLIVCWLEFRAVAHYLGTPRADEILRAKPYHEWVYRTVLRDETAVGSLVARHGLVPPPLL